MRSMDAIQRAHDILRAVLTGEVRAEMANGIRDAMTAACDVLCWVLMHEHNPTFAANLQCLERELGRNGYVLFDKGEATADEP